MTIEIHRPALEALIRERMKSGAFQNVEDALIHALQLVLPPDEIRTGVEETPNPGGADLVAALQASPCKEISLEPLRDTMPVRHISF